MQNKSVSLLGVIGILAVIILVSFFVIQHSRTVVIEGIVSVPDVLRTEMACMILPDSEIDPENPPTCNGFGGNIILTVSDGTEYILIDENGENYFCGGVETFIDGAWEDVYSGCSEEIVRDASYSARGVLDGSSGQNLIVQSIKPL